MPVTNTKFSTLNGNYYVEMTRAQAKDKNEFDRIDSNHDKKLQGNEICDERDREVCKKKGNKERFKGTIATAGIFGTSAAGASGVGIPVAAGIALLAVGGYYAADYFVDGGEDALKVTQKYRQQHRLDANF